MRDSVYNIMFYCEIKVNNSTIIASFFFFTNTIPACNIPFLGKSLFLRVGEAYITKW